MDNEDIKVIGIVLSFVVLTVLGFSIFNKCSNNTKNKKDIIYIVDTSYNKVVLDSIEVDIKYKDSVIKRIKYNMKYEINKINTINDSAAIELFKKLCTD